MDNSRQPAGDYPRRPVDNELRNVRPDWLTDARRHIDIDKHVAGIVAVAFHRLESATEYESDDSELGHTSRNHQRRRHEQIYCRQATGWKYVLQIDAVKEMEKSSRFAMMPPNHQRIEMTGAQRSVIPIRCWTSP